MFVYGKKIGMTRFFLTSGESISVTAVFLSPVNVCGLVLQKEFTYKASFGHTFKNHLMKPKCGELKFLNFFGNGLYELILQDDFNVKVGDSIEICSLFHEGEYINVSGFSKGKGFSGVVKRHNFKTQPATHGNSVSHRAPGSIGQCQSPGKVFKGKKMAGQLGNKLSFVKNAKIVFVNVKYNFLLLKGCIPGCVNSFVKIMKTV